MRLLILAGLMVGLAGITQSISAQGMTNINVTGISPVIEEPFTDVFEENFRNGRYQVIFTYNNNNAAPVDFRFQFRLTRGGEELINVTSEPKSFRPGAYVFTSVFEDLPFRQTFDQVMSQLDNEVRNQVVQEGTIPEGSYILNIEAIPENNSGTIASPPSVTPFTVRYPQTPTLINPPDQSNLTLETPVFNWTPIVGMQGITVDYSFLLVEVLDFQTPVQALNSNRAHAQRTLTNQNSIVYTPEFLPLEEGQQYAWQVTAGAQGQTLPIKNDGVSEISTFVYKEGSKQLATNINNLGSIPLIPDFARLVNLDEVEVDELTNSYEINGDVGLELDFNGTEPKVIDVQLSNLRIQKGSLDFPVLMDGSLRGNGSALSSVLNISDDLVSIDEIMWEFGQGISASAELQKIGKKTLNTEGTLNLTKNGANGTIRASGEPLFSFDKEVVVLQINEVQASFPEGTITGKGEIQLFGNDTACSVSSFAYVDGTFKSLFRCNSPFEIPLVQGSTRIDMQVNRIIGDIDANPEDGELDYNFELNSSVGLQPESGRTCGSNALVTIDNETGFDIETDQQDCRTFSPKVDLGFITLALTKTNLQNLSFNPSNKNWDFELNLGAKIEIPSFGQWESAEVDNMIVDEKGIHFGAIDFGDAPIQLPRFNTNDFGVELNSLTIAEFLFPLFQWDKQGPGPWDLSFAGQVKVPRKGNLPECVRGRDLNLSGGHVEDDRVFGEVSMDGFADCTYEFGKGYALNVKNLGGRFGTKFNDDGTTDPIGRLDFVGNLELGQPFACEGKESVQLAETTFSFTTGLNGTVENVVPGCDVALGPFTTRVTDSELTFAHDTTTGQKAAMDASAELELPEGQIVEGSFGLNLMTGRFTDVEFIIDDPFIWSIPQQDPVLSFRINRARIDENGFSVDGRNQFLLESGNQIGATFDNLLVDLETLRIKRGRIIFDENFGMVAGIDPQDDSMNFRAVELDAKFNEDPGLYMGLAGNIEIDSTGIHTDGQTDASVSFNGETYDELATVDFSKGFSFQLFPFKVGSGRADFLLDGSRFAWADPDGFHPVPGFFADLLLPDKLPMPTEDIAYLQLRDEDQLLVNATKNNDGNYVISTKANQPLTLYAPFLDDGNTANPPELSNVSLNNVIISGDPTNPEILQGSIEVDVPQNNPIYQMRGDNVPLTMDKIMFGSRQIGSGNKVTALHLLGNLHLFEEEVAENQEVGFYIQSDGAINANLDISGLNEHIPLLPGGQALLKFEAIAGNFRLQTGAINPSFNFNIDSGFEIATGTGQSTGAEFDLYMTQNKIETRNFTARNFAPNTEFDFGVFGLKLKAFDNIEQFGYTSNGFDFAFALDVDLRIKPQGSEEIVFPIRGLEIRDTGIQMPKQNISKGSIPGLDLPSFALAGFEFKPLKLTTNSPFTFSWSQGVSFDPNVNMSFEMQLPEFEGSGLNPSDGLTFKNVGLENGYLSGSINPFNPTGGAEISLVPGDPDSPTLIISEVFGSLDHSANEGQTVDIQLDGELGNLPAFSVDNPNACVQNPSFTLSLVESRYFEGSVTGVEPCGYVQLGPVKLSMTQADLTFSVSGDEQKAMLNGAATASMPTVDGGSPLSASGTLGVNLITGQINSGSISINQPFALNLPYNVSNPLLSFTVNQAVLDQNGLLIQGGGDLSSDGVQTNVTFNNLQMGFAPFEVTGGSASIASGLDVEVGVAPLSLQLKNPASALSVDNGIDINLNGGMELNSDGLGLSGTATASILYNGDSYASLRADLLNGFTLNVGNFAVNSGRAEFFDVSGPQDDLIAILDQGGFDPISGLTALLPSRLPLPSDDIAYIDIKDSNDNLLVDITENANNGGYTISTTGSSLPVVIPALDDGLGGPVQADVTFSLTTDEGYNVTGGSLSLENNLYLQQQTNLPLSLTELSIGDQGNGIELSAGLKVELPAPMSEHEAVASATINSNGLASGTVKLGQHRTSYQPGISPVYTYNHSGTISGSNEMDAFEAALWGVEASFGSSNSIALSGTISSSLVIDEAAGDDPLFYTASWSGSGWNFDIDPGAIGDLTMGNATLALNNQNGISIQTQNKSFYLVFNGTISMEDVLGEPLDVSIQNLEVGVDNYDSTPSMHFALGSSSGALADQSFALFEGALNGTIENPTVTLTGRSIGISSNAGTLTFLEKDIDYQNLTLNTDGGFDFGQIQAGQIDLIPDYLVMNSMTLTTNNGLKLNTELQVSLPDPVDQSSTTTISIYRDAQNQVQVDATAPTFDLQQQFTLGNFGHFKLTEVAADIDPYNWNQSGIYANGELYKQGRSGAIVTFGESGNLTGNPGIGISPAGNPPVQFNATGNGAFNFNFSIFDVSVGFDQIATTQNGFEVELSGSAGINLGSLSSSSSLGFEGFVIDQSGVKDTGNLDGTGSIDVQGIGTLEIGPFFYEKFANGKQITITDTSPKGPDELNGDRSSVPVRQEDVSELLCFGPCPAPAYADSVTAGNALEITINAGTDGDSGSISGGVESIYFMKTTDGKTEFLVDDLNASLMDNFSINGNLHYMKDGSDFLLRAAASGQFSFGDNSVSAAVAGKFANIGGETSFGLFVAAQSSMGIPIVPGIVDLRGAGAGFFWKPEQADIDMVQGAMPAVGHTLVDPDRIKPANNLDFAAFLYANLGIAGGGGTGQYVVEGSTFIQITSASFYMDARGNVLGLDGSSGELAGASLNGTMSFTVQSNPTYIHGTIGVHAVVPATVDGEGSIEYFAKDNGNRIDWGIMGNADYTLLSGAMTGGGEFLASRDGFLIEVTAGFDVDVPVIKVKSELTGSVWLITDPSFSLPFGAYAIFEGKACLGVCISAEAKAAFVTKRPSGYELYAAVQGCVSVFKVEKCVKAWASLSNDGLNGGFGPGSHNDLIAQARAQRDQFRQKIQSMLDGIADVESEMNQPPEFTGSAYSGKQMRRAGANFYAMDYSDRRAAVNLIKNEVETSFVQGSSYQLPSAFQPLINNVMLADRSYLWAYAIPELSRDIAKSELEDAISQAKDMSNQVSSKLSEGLQTSIKNVESAEAAFDDMLTSMGESPVSSVNRPAISENVTESPSFNVDETKAADQASNTEALREEIDKLDQQFRQSIAAVDSSLQEMHGLLSMEFEGTLNAPSQEGTDLGALNPNITGGNDSNSGNTLSVTPSVNALARSYMDVYSKLEKYFATQANWRWMEWGWAQKLRADVQQQRGGIQNGIQTLNSGFNSALANRSQSPDKLTDEAARVAQRNYAIVRFANDNFSSNIPEPSLGGSVPQSVNDLYNQLSNPGSTSTPLSDLRDSVATYNNDFWYEMHEQGLDLYAQGSTSRVQQEVVTEHSQMQYDLRDAHENLTGLLDQFYTNKASITSILYNMIDNYLAWRQSIDLAGSSSGSVNYSNRLQELSDELVPPQIIDIRASGNRPSYSQFESYFNITDISWSATHPVRIVENSIDIKEYEQNTGVSTGRDDYLSVGDAKSITVYPYKRAHPRGSNPSQNTVDFYNTSYINAGVRVRGYAGNTAVRRATFNVDVGPGGNTVGGGGGGSGSSVLAEDTTPPEKPSLYMGSYYEKSSQRLYSFDQNEFVNNEKFWTSDGSMIKLQIHAHDPESDIATFEYAVGTSQGGTDVVNWTELQGTREFLSYIPTAQMLGQTRLINMQAGTEYYVSVRVTNGAGDLSPVRESSIPVIFDDEAPSKPGMAYTPVFSGLFTANFGTPVDPLLQSVPSPLDVSTETVEDWADVATPEITPRWTASSDNNEVQYYEYIISESDEVPLEDFDDPRVDTTEDLEVTYTGEYSSSLLQDFETELYLHVRAKDYAGNYSEVLTIGPRTATDPTPPTQPKMRAKVNLNDVKLYFTQLPYDSETDMEGIQYAVGTSAGGTDLRDWPDGKTADFEWANSKSINLVFSGGGGSTPDRYVTIPKANLPQGARFYISYRAVNGQGMKSSVRATGPISFDNTRPETPSVDATYRSSDGRLDIDVSNIVDEDSGIMSVSYSVRYPMYYTTIKDWTEIHNHTGIRNGTFSLSEIVYLDENNIDDFKDISVLIRITNGAGLQRNIKRDLTFSDSYELKNYDPNTAGSYSLPPQNF